MRHLRARQAGTTLVELVVGLAIGTVLVLGTLSLMEQAQKAYMQGSEATDLQQNIRVGMDRIVRIVQTAGVNPTNQTWGGATANDPAFTAFREAGRNCIRIYADLNGSGGVQQTDENVFFLWSGTAGTALTEESGTSAGQPDVGQPWVGAGTGPQELARGLVANPGGAANFRYFTGPNDASPNTELAPPAASATSCQSLSSANRARIARVMITLTGRATVGGETLTKTLTSEARARNVP